MELRKNLYIFAPMKIKSKEATGVLAEMLKRVTPESIKRAKEEMERERET